jgi:hypothetical protein
MAIFAVAERRTVAFQREEITIQFERSGPSCVCKLMAVEASQEVAALCMNLGVVLVSESEFVVEST